LFKIAELKKRYLYYGLNQQKVTPVGLFAQGTLYRYDLGSQKTIAILNESAGIQGVEAYGNQVAIPERLDHH